MAFAVSVPLMSTSYTPLDTDLSTPMPLVALACGSKSHSSTRLPLAFTAAARLTQVVVLPTPPFWLTMAMILDTANSSFYIVSRPTPP